MGRIIIGKYALESLTSGMYSDPLVVFREYIQNAADSIDSAYKQNFLSAGEDKVIVELFPFDGRIEINDNGIGILSSHAERTLTGIGNSKKDQIVTRGFRGIGRLAALGYCQKLIFETSFIGENIRTQVVIDASKLTKLLLTNSHEIDIPAEEVMNEVCSCEQTNAPIETHYFRVIMEGIDQGSDLLKPTLVKEYLEQVAPVPFNPDKFSWGKEICNRVQKNGYNIPSYNIQMRCGIEKIEIYKPYQDAFLIDKSRNETDNIQDILIHKIVTPDNELAAIIWVGQSGYKSSIADKKVKGLRMRKGNILIGGWQTLNNIFKDARFNGWTIGEVYILDPKLLPNARRDNFEKNISYFSFSEKMAALSSEIIKQIKNSTLKRNPELLSAIEKTDLATTKANDLFDKPYISPNTKGKVVQKISAAKKALEEVDSITEAEETIQEIAFNELDILLGKIQGATSYKAINLINSLTKTEKKILERVFQVIQNELSESEIQKVTDTILSEFCKQ